jgi:hypothetical protein
MLVRFVSTIHTNAPGAKLKSHIPRRKLVGLPTDPRSNHHLMVGWRNDGLVPWVNGPPVPLLEVETRYEPAWMALPLCRLV